MGARDEPLRVLYSFPHALDRPGIAETARQQIVGLAGRGVDVTLFCTSVGRAVLPANVRVHETMMIAGRRLPHRAIGVQRAYDAHDWRVARWLRRHPDAVDIVHAWPRSCLRTLAIAKELRIPALRESPNPHTASVIAQSAAAARNAGVALPPDHSHAANSRVLARELLEYAAATFVLVPSDYAREEFIARGYPSERLLQHRYGCDIGRFASRPVDRRDGPFRAVFVGRGDPTKGLHVALAAWTVAALPDAELRVAGAIQPDYRDSVAPLLERGGVIELGFVDDVPSILAAADVLLLPSWTEGSALVTLEAQASGCVPLISAASGPLGADGVDFIEHPVGSVETLASQLRELASQPARLAALSARGTARREFLSWDTAAAALEYCYRIAISAGVRVT